MPSEAMKILENFGEFLKKKNASKQCCQVQKVIFRFNFNQYAKITVTSLILFEKSWNLGHAQDNSH